MTALDHIAISDTYRIKSTPSVDIQRSTSFLSLSLETFVSGMFYLALVSGIPLQVLVRPSLSHRLLINMIRTENVEPSKPRGSGRKAGVRLAIGKAGTVEKARRRSPKSKFGDESRHQAFRRIAAQQQHTIKSPAASSQNACLLGGAVRLFISNS